MLVLPCIDMKQTGRNIHTLRVEHGFSVRQLQDYFGFSTPQAIYKWQHGDALPSVDNLLALSVLFQVPMERILIVHEQPTDP